MQNESMIFMRRKFTSVKKVDQKMHGVDSYVR